MTPASGASSGLNVLPKPCKFEPVWDCQAFSTSASHGGVHAPRRVALTTLYGAQNDATEQWVIVFRSDEDVVVAVVWTFVARIVRHLNHPE